MVNKIIIGLIIGLLIGLAAGFVLFSVAKLQIQNGNTDGTGTNNQVQVSGTIQDSNVATIKFTNLDGTITSSAPDVNGAYSILLLGNQSYVVQLIYQNGYLGNGLSTYIPSGVTIFTANF